jgi:hypothetical protein
MVKVKKVRKKTAKKPVKKKKAPAAPKEGEYMGIAYESFCELSCIYFAEEMMKLGYVAKIARPPSYSLCDPVTSSYAVQLKKGSKQETQTIANGVTYTPDFDIYFTEKALGVFCWELGSHKKWDKNLLVASRIHEGLYRATVEVKPDFSRNSTTPKSVQSMKWLYQRHGVFVNLFRPNRVFEGLFVPEKYKYTERGTLRLLKFKVRNIQEYIKTKG